MQEKIILILLMGLFISSLTGQEDKRFKTPLSPRTANYNIHATLNTDTKQIIAQQTLTFKNPSNDTIWTMPFHMYYNAFKNNKTLFYTGGGRIPKNKSEEDIKNGVWGWIEITEVIDEKGNNLSQNINYVLPENKNKEDHTVAEIQLIEPILPHATYELKMKWISQIPKAAARTGYNRDYYFMVQWFPKLGVYEPEGSRFATQGQWNCHHYYPTTEYFGEFGVYEVTLDVPKDFIVGASGFLLDETINTNRKKVTYLAEDVIDFAWTAHTGFEEIIEYWEGIEIKLLIRPEHICNQERFLKATKNTLSFFENYLEKYPYPTLTIVSPPYHGLFSGAMEYPTLFTAPTLCDLPQGIKTTETLTIHELTHQYFMQILATNEQEEPWLDEGFTSFFEAKILDKYYPEGVVHSDYLGMNISSNELRRGRFFNADNIKINPISDFGFHFKHGSYAEIVYGKAAVTLKTLEGLVGEKTMQEIMQTYFKRWKFKHPCRNDFFDVVNEVVQKNHGDKLGENMNWFFEQTIMGTEECDYAIHSISNDVIESPLGFFDNISHCITERKNDSKKYQSKIIIYRNGEMIMPQEIKIFFENGDQKIEYWDGKDRSFELNFISEHKIDCAEIDPLLKITLDKNLINNSYSVQAKKTGIRRYFTSFFTWMENIMVTASALI